MKVKKFYKRFFLFGNWGNKNLIGRSGVWRERERVI